MVAVILNIPALVAAQLQDVVAWSPSTTMGLGPSIKNVMTFSIYLPVAPGSGSFSDFVDYMMAQVSKATIPRDIGGPSGKRIKVDVNGNLGWSLRVGAFETGRKNPSDWLRYSLVVLNCA